MQEFNDEFLQKTYERYRTPATERLKKLDLVSSDIKRLEKVLKEFVAPITDVQVQDERVGRTSDIILFWDGDRVMLKILPKEGQADEMCRPLLECKAHMRLIASDHLAELFERSMQQGVSK